MPIVADSMEWLDIIVGVCDARHVERHKSRVISPFR